MPSLREPYPEILQALRAQYGRPPLPSVEGEFEAVVRAYLEHQAGESKARVVLEMMRDAGVLDAQALAEIDAEELSTLVGVTRKPPRWAGVLRRLAAWYVERGEAEGLQEVATEQLRESLRAINGLGPGSVDVVLLRGLNRAAMPVDRASARVLIRHGWIDSSQDYDEIRQTLEGLAPDDPEALSMLASGLEQVATKFCKPAKPRCEGCPLRPWLPESGPIDLM
ncbi:MAG TPA: hypothetical protein VFT74_07105 [Isosphaeraceae bacterium]|nr:hypothetical protein [Isosphaeraceae bacterium]